MGYVPGNKFGLLLWKNWLLQKRKIALTVFEIIIPVTVAVLLLAIRQTTQQTAVTEPTTWDAFSVDGYPDELNTGVNWTVPFSPTNVAVLRLMQTMSESLGVGLLPFSDEDSMKEFMLLETLNADQTLGGVAFQSDFPSDGSLPDKLSYKIRMKSVNHGAVGSKSWRTGQQYNVFPTIGPRNVDDTEGGNPGYYSQGFLAIQRALDAAIIYDRNNSATLDEIFVTMKRFPYPSYIEDEFLSAAGSFMPFVIMLSFLILAPSIVKDIVLEKERKLKESMKLMGMPNWMHWLAWFIKYLCFLTISVVIMTICFVIDLGNGGIFPLTAGSLLFVFLMLYAVSLILFCFAISVFLSGSNVGAAAGGILYFLTYIPYFFIEPSGYENMALGHKMLACLLPNCAMAMGVKLIVNSEFEGIGAQWRDLGNPINADDTFTFGMVLLMLLIDIVLALLITWYVDAVFPGDYGVPKPWYFFVTKWYWCGGSHGSDHQYDIEGGEGVKQGEFFEQFSSDIQTGIKVQGLRKEFKKFGKPKQVAVDSMYLDMYEGQITALLGHNGAGKTTTMFMLTGFIPPTKGTAKINGFDICTDIDAVRENLGLCPQHDVLYDTLTVTEHLQFFASLKGCDKKQIDAEIEEILNMFKLQPKRNAFAKSLSGGMKRKLSVGMALIGGSKIVILDEPTSGMDPEARRQTWDILQTQRKGRTIILSTHFMDEADYLGDRIAIMASGKLVCCGSSLFLKKKYGVGYHMAMVKEPGCDVRKVEDTIAKYVPEAKLESNISAELSYILPHESSAKFEDLFTVLENGKKALGIASFGASVTTMEEVFLKVGEGLNEDLESTLQNRNYEGAENQGYASHGDEMTGQEDKKGFIELNETSRRSNSAEAKKNGSKVAPVFGVQFRRNTGLVLHLQQFWAMFMKKVIYTWRSPLVTVVQLLIPIIFTLFACLTVYISDQNSQDPEPLTINFSYFESPVMRYRQNDNGYPQPVTELTDAFDTALKNSGSVEEVQDQSLKDDLLSVADDNLRTYKNSYLVAADFQGGYNGSASLLGFTGYFQNEAIHSPALALNSIGNTLLQYFTGETKYSLEVINHPLPVPASIQSTNDIQANAAIAFAISINITFGMSFLVATFVLFSIRERYVKAKHCQFVSGVSTVNFWLSSFAWDLINFMIPALVILILFVAFDVDGYTQNNNLGYVFLLFLLYGAAILPTVYLFSFMFDVAATGYIVVAILNLFTGLGGVIVVFILQLIESTETIGKNLEWLFYIFFPNFGFAYSLQELYNNYQNRLVCETLEDNIQEAYSSIVPNINLEIFCNFISDLNNTSPCCPDNCGDSCANFYDNIAHWSSPGIGRGILFLCLQFLFFSALIFFLESGMAKRLKSKIFASASSIQARTNEDALLLMGNQGLVNADTVVLEDSDVVAEQERIKDANLSELMQTDSVVLREIKKYYGSFLAVDNLSVGIPQGECFGLLGVNGAGKTSTFKMLTGDESISSGKALLCGHNVSTNIKKVQQNVGYCPQFDALIDKLTVSETLSMYARLRGVQQSDVSNVVANLITNLLLTDYKDKQAGQLSGGNKRKLSTAIALIGDPPVVFLDEPTTGMDPVARRLLWNTLTQVRESGRTIVLTSHSMEECEALCTRIAIMVNGQFKCLGGSQHLKNRFGEGYTLMAKVTPGENPAETETRTRTLMDFIVKEFPACTLKDLHRGLVMYQIKSANLSWARVFGTMERAKVEYCIEDYSVSQTTLEQVFINFARSQVPPIEDKISTSAKCRSCCRFMCCCGIFC